VYAGAAALWKLFNRSKAPEGAGPDTKEGGD